jgi:hypothetical protein
MTQPDVDEAEQLRTELADVRRQLALAKAQAVAGRAEAVDPDELDPTGELTAQIEAQTREYGTYEATSRIYAGNALAYDIGHPVPISNVVKHGYWLNGQVALVDGATHDPAVAESIPTPAAAGSGDGDTTGGDETPTDDDTEGAQ